MSSVRIGRGLLISYICVTHPRDASDERTGQRQKNGMGGPVEPPILALAPSVLVLVQWATPFVFRREPVLQRLVLSVGPRKYAVEGADDLCRAERVVHIRTRRVQ